MSTPVSKEPEPETVSTGDDGPPPPTESYARRQNIVAALVPLVIGVVAAVLSWQLGVGSLAEPGPGLWPLVVSVAMVVVSAVLLLRSHPTGAEEKFTREGLLVAVGAASLVGYALLFEMVGFEIPTVALLVLWLKGIGREGWRLTITLSLCATTALYLLFITGLGVSLPHIVHF